MKNYFTQLFVFLIIVFIIGCSQTAQREAVNENEYEKIFHQDVNLEIREIYSWVNLMPGNNPRFHITGDFDLLSSYKYQYESLNLKKVIVNQERQFIYSISPKIKQNELESQNRYSITFSTIKGLLMNEDLNIEKPIDIVLVFDDGDDEYVYFLENIKINKVY